jgi:CDP-2,3-bis-(O-geranylgeranyl)-sn-glycerol synthase
MVANMTPVLLRGIKVFRKPINARIFGENKTWRGFIGGTLAGTLFYYLLFHNNLTLNLLFGFLLSFGALTGDLVKSFLKRRAGIDSGESWALWDQIDYVLGAIIFTFFLYQYSFAQIILLLIVGGILSTLAHRFSYVIKIINTKS